MALSDENKTLLRHTLPSLFGVLSGAITVITYLGSVVFTQNDARIMVEKINKSQENQEKFERVIEANKKELLEKILELEESVNSGNSGSNKEVLGRLRDLDNNINRRIDNLYEKLIERKR